MAPRDRPIITFLTDFGFDGAAATCRGVMLSICRDAEIVDVSHAIAKFAVADGAFVLRAALPFMPVGVHVAVVDPGVGTARRPIALCAGRGDVLAGPDNGLLVPAAEALGGIAEARELTERSAWLPTISSTFHGRDIFSPVAAHLANGDVRFEDLGPLISADGLVRLPAAVAAARPGRISTAVTYVDSFGNLRLAGGRRDLTTAFGEVEGSTRVTVSIGDRAAADAIVAPSFGHVPEGAVLLYVDSSGDLALAEHGGNLAARIGSVAGHPVVITRRD